ncbi:MAG: hypothetical protein WCH61_02190 [bacterium]
MKTAKTNWSLPLAARELLPHQPPMRFIDQLVRISGQDGTAVCRLSAEAIIVDADGHLEPAAVLELMAQAYATVIGYDNLQRQRGVEQGFLVGCRHVQIYQPVPAGQPLTIQVNTVSTIAGFAIGEGEVSCQGERLASGTIKIWLPSRQEPAATGEATREAKP